MNPEYQMFVIVGMFFAILMGFFSQVARGKSRMDYQVTSVVSVINLLALCVFAIVYLFMVLLVLNGLV